MIKSSNWKPPKIKRDVAMTFTSYVANTGGLLGLCLGFSFISLVEILFWVCCCLRQVKGWFRFEDIFSKGKLCGHLIWWPSWRNDFSRKIFFSNSCMFLNPNIFFQIEFRIVLIYQIWETSRNILKKHSVTKKLFWPFTLRTNCSIDLKIVANSRLLASNFKSFSRPLEQFFLTVAQNNFGNKTPSLCLSSLFIQLFNCIKYITSQVF